MEKGKYHKANKRLMTVTGFMLGAVAGLGFATIIALTGGLAAIPIFILIGASTCVMGGGAATLTWLGLGIREWYKTESLTKKYKDKLSGTYELQHLSAETLAEQKVLKSKHEVQLDRHKVATKIVGGKQQARSFMQTVVDEFSPWYIHAGVRFCRRW